MVETVPSSIASADQPPLPSNETIRKAIVEILPTVDLASTGVKKFRKLLKKRFGGSDLSGKNAFIKEALTEAINNMDDEEEEQEGSDSDDSDGDSVATPTNNKKKKSTGGYNKPNEISEKLATFLDQGPEMSRPQIVKHLWVYIKEHELQNPNDKREIILDKKMKSVFGCDSFTMFSMNKYISAHTHPFKPLDLTSKKKAAVTPSPDGKRASRSGGKRKAAAAGSDATKKKRKTGTQPPYRLSEALMAVLQKPVLPRPQVVAELWVYIKANNLQNPNDKREILCDEKLSKVFGGKKKVTMFSMNKYISPHLIEKVEKSEYQHDTDVVKTEDDSE